MYAIWLLPQYSDEKYLKNIIDNLSFRFGAPAFQPHITIFGLIDEKLENIESIINNSIERINPFIVHKSTIRESNNFWKTIFIDLVINEELNKIHDNFYHKFSKSKENKFSPHISLIYKNMNLDNRKKILNSLIIKNYFLIDKISILHFSENILNWKIVKNFNL